jgi:N-acetylglucosaminyl-diphospho-decaprenol L-rhamnosyltransferase
MLARALVPAAVLPRRARALLEPWRSPRPRRVAWAVGACVVARTATLRRLGPFDERIFLYAEDLELGLRAAQAGVETWLRPDARALHLDAHASAAAFAGEPLDLLARQRRMVVGERGGRSLARRDHWALLLTYADRIALKTLARRSTTRERAQLAAQWRARRVAPHL